MLLSLRRKPGGQDLAGLQDVLSERQAGVVGLPCRGGQCNGFVSSHYVAGPWVGRR